LRAGSYDPDETSPTPRLALDGLDDPLGRLLAMVSHLATRFSGWCNRVRFNRRRQTVLALLEATGPLSGLVGPRQAPLSLELERTDGELAVGRRRRRISSSRARHPRTT